MTAQPLTGVQCIGSAMRLLTILGLLLATGLAGSASAAAPKSEGRVTQIVRDVKVLPEEADPRPATMNDKVGAGEAVRTGDASRSELTFADLTISRLGA